MKEQCKVQQTELKVANQRFSNCFNEGRRLERGKNMEREAKAIKRVKAAQAEAAKAKREAKTEVQETKSRGRRSALNDASGKRTGWNLRTLFDRLRPL